MINESETFKPINAFLSVNASYTEPLLLRETSSARLFRVSRAGKYFIIKTTKDNFTQSMAMLRREYELSVSLSHYHLPYFFTFEEITPVGPGIVMEYVEGRNLSEFLAENPSLDARKRIFRQILDVVVYIHKKGIRHNDLKPENILITQANNDVKLLDFGLSDDDAHFLVRTLGCTPTYASPELLQRADDIDSRSDIYSLGKLIQQIFGNRRYCAIAKRCLAIERERRFTNVELLLRKWQRMQRLPMRLAVAGAFLVMMTVAFFVGRQTSLPEITELQKVVDKETIKRNQVDSVAQQVEQTLHTLYMNAEPHIVNQPTREQALNTAIELFQKPSLEYQRQVNYATYPSLEVQTEIVVQVNTISARYVARIDSLLNATY